MFVDRVRIQVRGGNGGAGVSSFVRRRGLPKGKPSGGTGGGGGDVYVRASADVASLLKFSHQPHWIAGSGTHGEGDFKHGKAGEDLYLEVPLGTMVYDEENTLIADLVKDGHEVKVAYGGRGGRGNSAFVTPDRRAPTFAEQGEFGDSLWISLELKLIADAALIGFPNAGKSTLISRVSAAKPKIAEYPFTTLEPNLGVVSLGEREFVLADIPGLIEGAAEGKGLGHEFLRHTERARVLVILLDPSEIQETSYADQLRILLAELAAHSPDLVNRPYLVSLSKTDTIDDVEEAMEWAERAGITLYPISSVTGDGLDQLMYAIADEVEEHVREAPEREGFVLHRPLRSTFEVNRRDGAWVITGRAAERAVNLADLTVPEAADFSAKRLGYLGVDAALEAAGAVEGDDVRIGDIVFTYMPARDDELEEN
ncbi:MAG: GTPase ObgE [Acidimicrobiia bacterium]|nr:GTPase ObgE [Acidimicrobiia bacterium]